MGEAKTQVRVLLKYSLEDHAFDHHRRAKWKLQNVSEHAGDGIIGVDAAFQRMDEQQQVQGLGRVKKRLEDRIVELPLPDGMADLQSFKPHGLCLFRDDDRFGDALQWHAAEANETIRVFLNDCLNRLVLSARKVRCYCRFFPVK